MIRYMVIAVVSVAAILIGVDVCLYVARREDPYDAKMYKRYVLRNYKELLKEYREEKRRKNG